MNPAESTPLDVPPVIPARAARLTPVSSAERIVSLDVLRGIALLGILLVNIAWFSSPVNLELTPAEAWTTPWDRAADWIVRFVAEGKFYPLFSMLFGAGFALQWQRAAASGAAFTAIFVRRLVVLLCIGIAHGLLLSEGDVLMLYAVIGLVLLAFRRRRTSTLLVWAGVMMAFSFLAAAAAAGVLHAIPAFAQAEDASALSSAAELFNWDADETVRIFSQGTFHEIFMARLGHLALSYAMTWLTGPIVLAMFLVGMAVARSGVLSMNSAAFDASSGTSTDTPAPRGVEPGNVSAATDGARERASRVVSRVRWITVLSLLIGVPLSVVAAVVFGVAELMYMTNGWLIGTWCFAIGGPIHGIGYAGALLLLLRKPGWQLRLRAVAAAGRMPLTNYLLQSVACNALFYSYGLGLYGSVGRAMGVGLALVIFAAQMAFSVWWLKHFRTGPMEWVWRVVSYGGIQRARPAA